MAQKTGVGGIGQWWPDDDEEHFSLPLSEVLRCLQDDAWRRKKGRKGVHPTARGHEVQFRQIETQSPLSGALLGLDR